VNIVDDLGAESIPTSTPVLEIKGAAVHFGGIKAVDGVSMALGPGQIYGILGPNGSGKSTLLAAITRMTSLTQGELLFDGKPYGHVSPERVAQMGIGRTFQTVRLLDDLTVLENIQLGADFARRSALMWRRPTASRTMLAERVERAIEQTELGGLERLRPSELSYGFQRRVEIARAIAMDPRLLLLDEPTAGMNHSERREIGQLLGKLKQEHGRTQLLVEHDVQMMIDTCDYLFAMNFGRLIAEGKPEEVVRHPAVQEAYLGKRGASHA